VSLSLSTRTSSLEPSWIPQSLVSFGRRISSSPCSARRTSTATTAGTSSTGGRRARKQVRVIGVVVKPCGWKQTRAAGFKLLPADVGSLSGGPALMLLTRTSLKALARSSRLFVGSSRQQWPAGLGPLRSALRSSRPQRLKRRRLERHVSSSQQRRLRLALGRYEAGTSDIPPTRRDPVLRGTFPVCASRSRIGAQSRMIRRRARIT
jgi:hypothetical protein